MTGPEDEVGRIRARKVALRAEMVRRVAALDPDHRAAEEAALLAQLKDLPAFKGASTPLLYVGHLPEEIDTSPLVEAVLAAGRRLICPRVDRAARRLRLHEVGRPAVDFRAGAFGIPEPRPNLPEVDPAEVDFVLVPGLAFDRRGYRLGRGAGYYDRLLPRIGAEVPRVALALSPQLVDEVPIEPHDRPVDRLLLPTDPPAP